MKSFKKYLIERSYTSSDIPKNFTCVIDIDHDRIKQLKQMKLDGVKGISSSGDIIFQFLGIGRNAFLVMDGNKTIELNKLSKFMYNNVHYAFSNNMANIKRLYQKRIQDNRGTWHNIADYVFKQLVDDKYIDKSTLIMVAPGQEISYTNAAKNTTVNSLKDAVKVFKSAMKQIIKKQNGYYDFMKDLLKISNKEYERIFEKSYKKYIGGVYSDEQEWIVKNNSLRIPKKSYLYVLVGYTKYYDKYKKGKLDSFEKLRMEDNIKKELMFVNSLNKELKNKYIIKYVDNAEWKRIQSIHIEKKYN